MELVNGYCHHPSRRDEWLEQVSMALRGKQMRHLNLVIISTAATEQSWKHHPAPVGCIHSLPTELTQFGVIACCEASLGNGHCRHPETGKDSIARISGDYTWRPSHAHKAIKTPSGSTS